MGVTFSFLQDERPQGVEGLQVWAEANQAAANGNPLFKLAVTDEVTTFSLDMYPEDVVPFFPVEDALWVNFQVFRDLPEGDDKGLRVDAVA